MRKFISHTAAPSLCLCFLLKKQTHKDIVICHRPDKINHGYTAQDNPGNRHTSSSPDTARGLGKSHKSQNQRQNSQDCQRINKHGNDSQHHGCHCHTAVGGGVSYGTYPFTGG